MKELVQMPIFVTGHCHRITQTETDCFPLLAIPSHIGVRAGGARGGRRFGEHLRSVGNYDVDTPVARYFNAANYPISDIKVSAISPINDDDDSRKRHDKRLF